MPSKPRFVLDTNVVISALLLRNSVARQAFDRALAVGEILVSVETITELHRVLQRKGFQRYVTEEERMEFLAAYVRVGRLVEGPIVCMFVVILTIIAFLNWRLVDMRHVL